MFNFSVETFICLFLVMHLNLTQVMDLHILHFYQVNYPQ